MNQILLTNNQKNSKYKENKTIDIKKIIVFFSIAIIIFAISIISIYTYKILKKPKLQEQLELTMETVEDKVRVIAKSDLGLNKIIYTWNDSDAQEIEMNGKKSYEEMLDIPEGNNTLNVKIIDQNNKTTEKKETFNNQENEGKPELKIDEEVLTRTGKIKIIASDETNKLEYITYQWNDEEEIKIEAQEDKKTIDTTIDVKRGKNKLKIKAVNSLGIENNLEKELKGVNKPIIKVVKNGNQLEMKITHDIGFKKIEFTINGQEYAYDENFSQYDSNKKEIVYKFDMKEGENIVIIHAVTMEDSEATYKGKTKYTVE